MALSDEQIRVEIAKVLQKHLRRDELHDLVFGICRTICKRINKLAYRAGLEEAAKTEAGYLECILYNERRLSEALGQAPGGSLDGTVDAAIERVGQGETEQ